MELTGNSSTKRPKPEDKPPALRNYGGKALPKEIKEVLKKIQKAMMDDTLKGDKRPKTPPKMPRNFIYSKVTSRTDIENMTTLARQTEADCLCYELFVPFRISLRKETSSLDSSENAIATWSGNIISFRNVSEDPKAENIIVVQVEEPATKPKKAPRGKPKFKDPPQLKQSEKLRSSNLVSQYSSRNLISAHYMTISWLRSRLQKAINSYQRSEGNNARFIPVIKQKEGSHMFLFLQRLQVGEGAGNEEEAKKNKPNALFAVYPAFQATPCHLVIPVISVSDSLPVGVSAVGAEELLWQKIIKCRNKEPKHKHTDESFVRKDTLKKGVTPSVRKQNSTALKNEDVQCEDVRRDLTSSQQQHCKECRDPASRMLLEYYYQYGDIPQDEMSPAVSLVDEILQFIKRSIKVDRRSNDPKIIEFVKSGSVPENLKVVQPDEFDVMVRIGLPESKISYDFYSDDAFPPGFAICTLSLKPNGTVSHSLKRCLVREEAFGTEHCLDPEKLAFGWLFGMLQLAINKYHASNSPKASLKIRRGGPALMLQITPSSSFVQSLPRLPRQIKVDLVLALVESSNDGRWYVPKRAKAHHYYKPLKRKKLDESVVQSKQQETEKGEQETQSEEHEIHTMQPKLINTKQAEIDSKTLKIVSENAHVKSEQVDGVREQSQIESQEERIDSEQPKSGQPMMDNEQFKMEQPRDQIVNAKKNLQYMWRVSCSAQEKKYLQYTEDKQQEDDVRGCQKICLKILKTICAREALKHQESVISHKLSSYILKTALFHLLSRSDLKEDWKIDCLADRYVDLMNKLSKLDQELPHFFFNNEHHLRQVFPDDENCCKEKASINLLDELHSTLKRQLLKRFSCIAKSFKDCKKEIDGKFIKDPSSTMEDQDYRSFLEEILAGRNPEEVIHPPPQKSDVVDEDTKATDEELKKDRPHDERVNRAVKNERRTWNRIDPDLNSTMVRESLENEEYRRQKRKREQSYDDDDEEEEEDFNTFLLLNYYLYDDNDGLGVKEDDDAEEDNDSDDLDEEENDSSDTDSEQSTVQDQDTHEDDSDTYNDDDDDIDDEDDDIEKDDCIEDDDDEDEEDKESCEYEEEEDDFDEDNDAMGTYELGVPNDDDEEEQTLDSDTYDSDTYEEGEEGDEDIDEMYFW